MSRTMDQAERLHFEASGEWHAWLREHRARPAGVWLVSWKARTGKRAVPYEEVVQEALCYGWIDSTYRSLDEERGMPWYSPRRKGSLWAGSNKARVEKLEAEGRMAEAGRIAVEAAKADGSWVVLEPVEAHIVPDDLAMALDTRTGARDCWEEFAPTLKRSFLFWIAPAKRADTRARRVVDSADLIAQGRRLEDR